MAQGISEVMDNDFETMVLESETPVLVDFWAPWCGPCKAMGPILEDLVKEYGTQVTIAKCNVDDNPVTPSKYGIRAIPPLIFFKDGQVADQITGMVSKVKIQEIIKKII